MFNEPADKLADDQKFENIAAVLNYLQAKGWKATKTSLYRHQAESKFLPQPDGTYLQKDIDKYAKAWLKQKSTGKRVSQAADELQRKIKEKELQNAELDYEKKRFDLDKNQGKYIPREQVVLEIVSRGGILKELWKNNIQSRAGDYIRVVNGDTKKIRELMGMMEDDWSNCLNEYANTGEWQVVFDGEEREEVESADEETPGMV